MPRKSRPEPPTHFRARWGGASGIDNQLIAYGDPCEETATLLLPDGQSITLDAATARAIPTVLTHVVFGVLGANGPQLVVEELVDGQGWRTYRPAPELP